MEILEVKNLTKSFVLSARQQKIDKTDQKVKVAVDNLSFKAHKGEIYGLLGPNGAGKTTTLRVIATLIKADAGDCFVDGFSVTQKPDEVRKRIGFLTSELKLEDFFTPNYIYDFFSELHGVPADERQQRKLRLFDSFGIDRFAEVKIANLSTGMKQKLSLVISMVHDPELIIFDEPTNGLDVLTAKVVTDFLYRLKEEGKSIIISTHIFSLAEKLCDRIGIVFDGKMAAEGTLSELTGGLGLEETFFRLYEQRGGSAE